MRNQCLALAVCGVLAVATGCESMGMGGGSDSGSGGSSARTSSSGGGDAQIASAKQGNPDALYLTESAHMGAAEVAASQLALKKAQDPQVKRFAQMMVDDHTRGNQQLLQLGQRKGLDLPKRPDELHTKGAAAMANMSGQDFDRQYMSCMVSDHAKLLSSSEDQAQLAKDPDVRAFAQTQVPMLREHYNMALQINRSLGGGATGGAGATGATGTSGTGTTGADAHGAHGGSTSGIGAGSTGGTGAGSR